MKNYLELVQKVLEEGVSSVGRTGSSDISLFGEKLSFDLTKGHPAVTTRKIYLEKAIVELLWFLRGSGDITFLRENNCGYWDAFVGNINKNTVGDMYPVHLRNWPGKDGKPIDQLAKVIEGIKSKPFSKRHVISYWNPASMPDESISPNENVDIGNPSLPPCHTLIQFDVRRLPLKKIIRLNIHNPAFVKAVYDLQPTPYLLDHTSMSIGELESHAYQVLSGYGEKAYDMFREWGYKVHALNMILYQRSCDLYLGAPSNIFQYALLQRMVAQVTGLVPHMFHYDLGNVHLYENQIENAKLLLERKPYDLCEVVLTPTITNIDHFTLNDIRVFNYQHHEPLSKVKVMV